MAFAPILGLAGSAISGVMGFMGSMQQAEAQAGAANYQAQVARNNEIIARNNAAYAAQAGAVRAQTQDFKNRTVLGTLEADQGASGIDFESGSSANVRRSARNVARLDTETIYNNALLQTNQALSQATSFSAQAGLEDFEARNARAAGTTRAFGSLLGGATSFADKWLKYQNAGISGFGSAL